MSSSPPVDHDATPRAVPSGGRPGRDTWASALDAGAEGLWDWSVVDDRIRYSENLRAILDLHDLSPHLSLQQWRDLLHPADRDAVQAALARFRAGRTTVYRSEHRIRCGDGRYKWMRAVGRTLESDALGRPQRVVGTYIDIDEAKATAASLQESQQRLQRIAERVPGSVFEFVLRPDGSSALPYVSPGFHHLFRVDLAALRNDGMLAYRYLDPAALERVVHAINESARDLTLWRQELPMCFPNGERRWLYAESMPERLADGSTRWHGFVSDITARRAAAIKLRESDERLRRITARIPGLVFEFRRYPDGRIALPYVSEGIRDLLGLAPEDVSEDATPIFARVHAEDLPRLHATIDHSVATITPVKEDFRIRAPDGSERWVRIDAVPMRAEDGTILSHGIISDITAAKRADAAVRREKAFVETLVQNLVTPTLVLGTDGRVRVWNRALAELTGVPAAAVVGTRGHGRVFYGDDRPMMADIILAGEAAGDAERYAAFRRIAHIPGGLYSENWCTLPTGRTHYMSGAAAPIHHEDGALAAVVETLYDLTERQHLQAELERARDAALSATRAKSAFLANMSHEIRTPLNGVIGMTALLAHTDLDAAQNEYVDLIRGSGEHLLAVIDDILDFSRIEAGQLEIEAIEFDLWHLLEDVAGALALRAEMQGLDFVCLPEPDLPRRVRGDPVRLRQVLINLAANAIKFTPAGAVVVRAACLAEAAGAPRLRFEVEDSGVGIAPERQADIFGAFVQADTSTTRKFGGSGLGLAICRELMALMGGEIGLHSTLGVGSTFWIALPLQVAATADTEIDPLLQGRRVLVIDHHDAARQLAGTLLAGWGCRPTLADTVATARTHLAAAGTEPFEIVLLDAQLPDAEIADFVRHVHDLAAPARPALIRVGSVGNLLDDAALAAAGHVAQVGKPLRQGLLQACLHAVLAPPTPPPPDALAAATDTAPAVRRLLLVEDNPINQKVARGLLDLLGYRVDLVDDGAAALAALARTPYDLVLMDCHLPVMDGFAATRAIRDPASTVLDHEIPVIAMTADVLAGDREACLAAGMNDYLAKPLDPVLMERVLAKWTASAVTTFAAGATPRAAHAAGTAQAVPDFDRTRLLDHVLGDAALADEIVHLFRGELATLRADLAAALADDDAPRCARLCHGLKGTAANVGAQRLHACAVHLEQLARANALPELTRQCATLDEVIAAFDSAVAHHTADT